MSYRFATLNAMPIPVLNRLYGYILNKVPFLLRMVLPKTVTPKGPTVFGTTRRCPQKYRSLIMSRLFGRKRTEPRRRGVLHISRDTLTRTSPCEVESPPTSVLPKASTSFALATNSSLDCWLNASRRCDSNSVFEKESWFTCYTSNRLT